MNDFSNKEKFIVKHLKVSRRYIVAFSFLVFIFLGITIVVCRNLSNTSATLEAIKTLSEVAKSPTIESNTKSDKTSELETQHPFLSIDFEPLKERNNEVVAWLKIEILDIDIPVVQHSDNEYYLTHDIDKKENSTGWVFINTMNSLEIHDFNTVFYGHNMLSGASLAI
jgi:sortase B